MQQTICTSHFTGKERDSESGLDYFGARYYGSALGRFTGPDTSDVPQPVPYAILERPQTLNLYAYVENNPLSLVDDNGHSDITFDGTAGTITVRAQVYDELGDRDSGVSFNASNNPQIALSIGKLVDGNYEFLDTSRPHHHSAEEDSRNGPYGPGGIFRLKPFTGADQKTHEGVGLHAGRAEMTDLAGRTGCNYATNGCVRTTEPAIKFITGLAVWDPLSTLTVTNNRQKTDGKKKDDNGDHPPPHGPDPRKPKRLIPRANGVREQGGGN